MKYAEKLLDSRWREKRIEILERDDWECVRCRESHWDTILDVHHLVYCSGHEPWEYDNSDLITLCRPCHEAVTMCGVTYEGIRNKWIDYEKTKKGIEPGLTSREYELAISNNCNTLSI